MITSEYESPERMYFALCSDGDLLCLGDCGDFDVANEIADDLGLEVVWLISGVEAKYWAEVLNDNLMRGKTQ